MYYRNEYLFSEIYLQEITQQAQEEDVRASLETIKEYREWADRTDIEAWKSSFVHEVLYALRFGIKADNDHLTLLYPSGDQVQPISLCYILLPDEDLNNTTMGRNWAEKIIRNLREHDLQWGLLTNGEKWRIYHLDEPTPYETYLEIDLAAILTNKATNEFRIFHKFMQAENFVTDNNDERLFDFFKKESQAKIDYIEEELANALKQKEEGGQGVLASLCMGYVEYLRERENPDFDDEDLRHKIYHGAMLYMFRLLFLLYADARNLLSDENRNQLEEIRGKSWDYQTKGIANTGFNQLWEILETIFVDIDQTYNGGLFNPYESQFTIFIEENRIADAYLSPAIFHLANYREKTGKIKPITYRDMSVRHLGTLYEGLLEHKLFITKEETEVRISKERIQFIPVSQGGKLLSGNYIKKGQVYFGSDSTERKATGSYYTPEPVVNYMVQKTLGEKLVFLHDRFNSEQAELISTLRTALDDKEKNALLKLLENELLRFCENQFLSTSIIDPAMGSGHFLVNSSNYFANFLTYFLNDFNIVGFSESSTKYWRRKAVENCIYGVDLNPLAVELAKLSLWINTMAKDQPLSFTNHHLKCGNSLIGVKLGDIGRYPGWSETTDKKQKIFFEDNIDFANAVQQAIRKYVQITNLSSKTLDDIAQKRLWLTEIDQILSPYKLICDFHIESTSRGFDQLAYQTTVEKGRTPENFQPLSNEYFHWELEFPNVLMGSEGFDVVVTNPPYLGEKGNKELFANIRKGALENYYLGKMDLFYLFFHLALNIGMPSSQIALITTNYYLTAFGGRKLRQDIRDRSILKEIINFNELRVFNSALGQHNMITILEKGTDTSSKVKILQTQRKGLLSEKLFSLIVTENDPKTVISSVPHDIVFDGNEAYIRLRQSDSIAALLDQIKENSILLGDICTISTGVQTGADKVSNRHINKYGIEANKGDGIFVLNTSESKALGIDLSDSRIIKSWFKNSDINRWFTKKTTDLSVLYLDKTIDELPDSISLHLEKFKPILEDRREVENGKIPWWQLQWPRNKDIFESPKIVTSQRSSRNNFAYNLISWYASADVYYILSNESTISLKYILAILNSKLIYVWLYHRGKRKGNTLELYGSPLKEIPIKVITQAEQEKFIILVNKILGLEENYLSGISDSHRNSISEYENNINELVYKLYQLDSNEVEEIEREYSK